MTCASGQKSAWKTKSWVDFRYTNREKHQNIPNLLGIQKLPIYPYAVQNIYYYIGGCTCLKWLPTFWWISQNDVQGIVLAIITVSKLTELSLVKIVISLIYCQSIKDCTISHTNMMGEFVRNGMENLEYWMCWPHAQCWRCQNNPLQNHFHWRIRGRLHVQMHGWFTTILKIVWKEKIHTKIPPTCWVFTRIHLLSCKQYQNTPL